MRLLFLNPVLALFRRYSIYYTLSLIIVLIGLISLLFTDKGDLVLFFNQTDSDALNVFFLSITKFGEFIGGAIVFILIYFFGFSKRYLIVFIVSVLLTTALAQGLKNTMYKNERRPAYSYKNLKPIEGLDRHQQNSFPSGHTTAAFTFFTLLTLGLPNRKLQFVTPFAAAIVGVSRVYLGQHYLYDIVAGAILGLFITSMVHLFFVKYNWLEPNGKSV